MNDLDHCFTDCLCGRQHQGLSVFRSAAGKHILSPTSSLSLEARLRHSSPFFFFTFCDFWCQHEVVIRAQSVVSDNLVSQSLICLLSCIQTLQLILILINKTSPDEMDLQLNGTVYYVIQKNSLHFSKIEPSFSLSKKYILVLSPAILTN